MSGASLLSLKEAQIRELELRLAEREQETQDLRTELHKSQNLTEQLELTHTRAIKRSNLLAERSPTVSGLSGNSKEIEAIGNIGKSLTVRGS
ncbi:hypothetical protein scyTo_0012885 [Scyliorhinus torazame]|uniref:cGMP-dependent protein kinase N-terminal coiled-coil domain-containing protein n=1 Tax=Scyliorhinus torazame TaxID=75743 RepID=A0A401NKA7_SCYTO|nr:hypothetical protein [Scyliorhinus torazame]